MKRDSVVHVEPVGDLAEHVLEGELCWCQPVVERYMAGFIIKHNALDGRPSQDATTRLPS